MPDATDQAFRAFFDSTYERIRSYCIRRLPPVDVNDAVAEVYLVAWRRSSDIPEGEASVPWLYAVAHNVVRNFQRGTRRSFRLKARMAREPQLPPQNVETQVVRHSADAALLTALGNLRSADREILILRVWDELAVPEIAAVLGCSTAAAEKRIERALTRLRGLYESPMEGTHAEMEGER